MRLHQARLPSKSSWRNCANSRTCPSSRNRTSARPPVELFKRRDGQPSAAGDARAVGGYNSGRHGGRPTVGSGLTLDLYKLIRQGLLKPGQYRGGSFIWTRVGSGERVGSVDYEAHMAADRGHVRLRYTSTRADNGEKRYLDYTISLETTPQTFGGRRWFVCPRTAERVSKLHFAEWRLHVRVPPGLQARIARSYKSTQEFRGYSDTILNQTSAAVSISAYGRVRG